MKYRLYSTLSGWTSRNESLESHLGIPDGSAGSYAKVSQVTNPENSDYEKFIMPVCTEGSWKCDDQFNSSDLVDYDGNWFIGAPG
jgi:hypothetical protein